MNSGISNWHHDWVRSGRGQLQWQERFESEADDILREMTHQSLVAGEPPAFRLTVRNDWFCAAAEYTARIKIEMGYLINAKSR